MTSKPDGAPVAAGETAGERSGLARVSAYGLAVAVTEHAWDDASAMRKEPLLVEIAAQLLRSAGSIGANIAEGYSRRSARDRIRYYEYALGSAAETEAWYQSARRALPAIFDERIARLTSVRRLLLTMIRNERSGTGWNAGSR
ncbi:MAG: four helix bundle protein [Gemmatimonadaceae bacterium]